MIIKVARKISIVTFLFFCFHKMSQATFFVTIPYSWKKIFYISGAIHSNNISVILILFEDFRNMYPYHRLFRNANLKYYFEMQLFLFFFVHTAHRSRSSLCCPFARHWVFGMQKSRAARWFYLHLSFSRFLYFV